MKHHEWNCGDPDSAQFLSKLEDSPTCWDCIEMRGPHPGINNKFGVIHTVIDLTDYTEEEIESYIKGYGYESRADVEAQYGVMAEQVIIECIFECLEDDFCFTGTEKACNNYINKIVKKGE